MMKEMMVIRTGRLQRDETATPRGRRRTLAALATVVASVGVLTVAAPPALAEPQGCDVYRIDDDTLVGGCRTGTGQFRFFIGCDLPSFLPDYEEYSPWLPAGSSASVSCNWGNHAYAKRFVLEG